MKEGLDEREDALHPPPRPMFRLVYNSKLAKAKSVIADWTARVKAEWKERIPGSNRYPRRGPA